MQRFSPLVRSFSRRQLSSSAFPDFSKIVDLGHTEKFGDLWQVNKKTFVPTAKEELQSVPDMAVTGLCIQSAFISLKRMATEKVKIHDSPLGRWSVKTDNFSKSYSYDHTA